MTLDLLLRMGFALGCVAPLMLVCRAVPGRFSSILTVVVTIGVFASALAVPLPGAAAVDGSLSNAMCK